MIAIIPLSVIIHLVISSNDHKQTIMKYIWNKLSKYTCFWQLLNCIIGFPMAILNFWLVYNLLYPISGKDYIPDTRPDPFLTIIEHKWRRPETEIQPIMSKVLKFSIINCEHGEYLKQQALSVNLDD